MALTPTDWAKRVELTGSSVTGTLNGLVVFINGDNIPADVWATAINGGGDLRVCTDSGGVNQLPIEVVEFDTIGQTGNIWVRFGSYSTSTRTLWLFYGKAGETQPLVTDTFGRNAVWADYTAAYHLNEPSNNTSGGYLNSVGTNNATGVSMSFNNRTLPNGMVGSGFNGSNDYIVMPNAIQSPSALNYTWQAWAQPDNTFNDQRVMSMIVTGGSSDTFGVIWADAGDTGRGWASYIKRFFSGSGVITGNNDTNSQAGRWDSLTTTFESGSNMKVNLNGVNTATASVPTFATNRTVSDAHIGRYNTLYMDGGIAEVRIREDALSIDWIAAEYDNQSDPSTFWTTGTPESTGGGGATVTGAFNLPALNVSGAVSATLPQPNIAGAFTLSSLSVAGSISATLPQPIISGNFTLNAITVSGSISASLPQPSIAGAFNLNTLSVNGAISATQPQPNITGAFTLANFLVNGEISVSTVNPELTGNILLPSLTVSGAANATLPQPSVSGNISLPSFNVSGFVTGGLPTPQINGNISLQAFTVSGIITATQPNPTIVGSFQLPVIEVQGFATVSGLVIVLDDKANINQKFLSANVNQTFKDNNINYI